MGDVSPVSEKITRFVALSESPKTNQRFNVGDIVMLKSGGPALTVRQYIPGKGRNQSTTLVDWFLSDEHYSATFFGDQLVLAGEKSSSPPPDDDEDDSSD